VKTNYAETIAQRKQEIEERLDPDRGWSDQPLPIITAKTIQYEAAEKTRAINCGGIGVVQMLVDRIGLRVEIDLRLSLLKRHLPYHESDHVMNIAYNALLGGVRLEDIDLRRNDAAFLDCLGAQRLPDPTTSGDFTRRFQENDIVELMDIINTARQRVWDEQPKGFLKEAFIDVDGTIAGTLGECKGGMSLSYKGVWGYHPLIISLANTREVLFLVNRPGNVVSHEGCVPWIDKAIDLVSSRSGTITLRGDTDFTSSGELDRWNGQGVKFIFGMDAHAKARQAAEALPESAWSALDRLPRYEIATEERAKPFRVKEEIVRQKGYLNKKLMGESVAEMEYQPGKCQQSYRVVIVRKNISVQKGDDILFDEIRYFFYITNRRKDAKEKIVGLANHRCDQENVIEQLKNGVNSMRMPVADLLSNWAYMVMTSLAWNLKAWCALLAPDRERGMELLRMEFRRFMHAIILVPAQIVMKGRQIIFRILSYNTWLTDLFEIWEHFRNTRGAARV
jgi:Transposase DDE domain group 1